MFSASIAVLLLAAAAAPSPSEALANRVGDPFSVTIAVGDIDLSRGEGRAELLRRADNQADRTCAPRAFPAQYQPRSLRACRDSFRDAAQRHIALVSAAQ